MNSWLKVCYLSLVAKSFEFIWVYLVLFCGSDHQRHIISKWRKRILGYVDLHLL